ncbi:MAG: hypothetical protein LDL23_12230 [Flavobacterium sp.]|jgi:hypothetical protein|uniref:hypothetical protein n=1 Tax=Flavobacterium sp. TaxID=239 RepID=UPI0025C27A92|nr:hypothetical protein [Flavobacterium sp.]MCA1967398.1 hypothetical protein [Flavobacterium sp.]
MKIRVLIGLLALSLVFSCKQKSEVEEKATQDTTTEAAAPAVTSIQLANYSDENWKNGVGLTFNMLLVDYSEAKYELISKGTELNLPSGEKVPYIGYEKQDNYIHIMLAEKPTTFQAAIEYPNEITIK